MGGWGGSLETQWGKHTVPMLLGHGGEVTSWEAGVPQVVGLSQRAEGGVAFVSEDTGWSF